MRREIKGDMEKLKSYVDAMFSNVFARFGDANKRISNLYGVVKTSLLLLWSH